MEEIENFESQMNFWQKVWHNTKTHKWYVFVIVVLAAFAVRGCSSSTVPTTVTTETYTVRSGTIENSLKVLGTTKITNLQTLMFGTEAKVSKIYVKEGDKVKAGQLLAELDKKQLNISLSQQSLSVQNARINYDKLINQYTQADILSAESNVSDAQTKLNVAKKQLADMSLDQGKSIQTNGNLVQTNIIFSKTVVGNTKSILQDMYDVLFGVNAQYISLHSNSNRSSANSFYTQAKSTYQDFQSAISSLESTSITTSQSVQNLQNKGIQYLNTLSSALDSLISALNDAVDINGVDASSSALYPFLTSLRTDNSQVLSMRTTANSNITSLQTSDNTIQTKKSEIKNYEAQLAMYKQSLADMQAGPNSNDKTLQLNSLKQSQLSLQQTSQQKDNYEIVAPFDGTVDAIGFKVGDTVSSNAGTSSNGITMSNPDIYEVTMLIDQIDIVKIDKGQVATILFDAYPGYSVTGAISNIDPTPVTNAGVVSYYASIALDKSEKKMYDGMSVTVNITLEKKDDIVVVPTAAIQTIRGTSAVVVMTGGTPVPTPIVVGITDGVNSEIISGLAVGDVVSFADYVAPISTTSSNEAMLKARQSSEGSVRALQGGASDGPGGFSAN